MGIPIDPTDPVNGGCPVCVGFLPGELHVEYDDPIDGLYAGDIQQLLANPAIFTGDIQHASLPQEFVLIAFCWVDVSSLLFSGNFEASFFIPNSDCDLPITFTSPDGAGILIEIP